MLLSSLLKKLSALGAQSTRTSLGAELPWTLCAEGFQQKSVRRVNPLFDALSVASMEMDVSCKRSIQLKLGKKEIWRRRSSHLQDL